MAMEGFSSAQVLITGGSEGIGRGLAARFLAAGAEVVVTGRSLEKLRHLEEGLPGVKTIQSDIGRPEERESLARRAKEMLPDLRILVNNAGIQRRIPLSKDTAPWSERQMEIDILLAGPVHLNHLLIPRLVAHGVGSMIVNVTSGGAFIPQPFAPIYSACKAALHSYTVNLRFALAPTGCRVVELIPPAVATGLGGIPANHGAPLEAFCDEIFPKLSSEGAEEIGYGMTDAGEFRDERSRERSMFNTFSSRFPIETYTK